jgi:hypothetical protein
MERDLSEELVFINPPWELAEHIGRHFESGRRTTPISTMPVFVGIGNGYLHAGRAGPTRGPVVATREVRRERWQPAKAPSGPADRR